MRQRPSSYRGPEMSATHRTVDAMPGGPVARTFVGCRAAVPARVRARGVNR